jgi:hypothetical protein
MSTNNPKVNPKVKNGQFFDRVFCADSEYMLGVMSQTDLFWLKKVLKTRFG